MLDRAEAVLAGLDEKLTLPLFKEILGTERESRKRIRQPIRSKRPRSLPSCWTSRRRNGKRPIWTAHRALKDYRGKVVLIDFWYRGCGWCIRAMPQMKQLADDFKEEPVAISGMNSDRNEADARFVINALKLGYPTLKNQGSKHAEGIAADYSISGFPTLVLINQQGVIRNIHVGYTPTLRSRIWGLGSRSVGRRQDGRGRSTEAN